MDYIPRGNVPSYVNAPELSASMESLLQLETNEPAMESFFQRIHTGNGPLHFNIKMQDLNSGSLSLAMEAVDNFRASIQKYSRDLSNHFNDCVDAMFSVNKTAMKMRSAQFKTAQKEKINLVKEITNAKKAHRDTAELENKLIAVDETLDRCSKALYTLKDNIIIRKDVFDAVMQCENDANAGFNMLGDLYKDYLNLVASQIKADSLLYGKMDAEKYMDALSKLVESIRMGGSFNRKISKLEQSIKTTCESKVYGNQPIEMDVPTVDYSLDTVKGLLKRYEWFREIIEKMEKRSAEIKNMILAIQGGKEVPFSFNAIILELVFLIHFSMELSTMMELYLDPHMGICKGSH